MVTKRRDANKRGQERLTSFIDLLKWRWRMTEEQMMRERRPDVQYIQRCSKYSLFSVFFEYLVHFPFLGLIILGDVLFEHWNLS